MSNLSYHQPKMPLRPNRLLLRTISGHQSYVTSVAFFGPLRDRIITGSYDELAKLWDLKTGRCLRKFSGHTDGITSVIPGPQGRIFTASEDRTIRVWDVDTGECARVIRSHSGAVTGLCILGADRIVTGSADKKLRVFDASGNLCGEAEFDGEIMAVASPPSPPPSRSRASGLPPSSHRGDIVKELFLSPETTRGGRGSTTPAPPRVQVFACGGTHIPSPAQPMLHVVDVDMTAASNAIAASGNSREHSDLFPALFEGQNKTGVVTCAAVSTAGARGRGILVTGSYDKGVCMLRNVLPSGRAGNIDGERGQGGDEDCNGTIEQETSMIQPPPAVMEVLGHHKDGVRSVAISADGRWAVSGGREGHIKVWEISQDTPQPRPLQAKGGENEPVADFEAHRGVVFSLCMSPDARVLLSAGSDNDVRVWDLSLVVYARRLVLNRSRELWTKGRVRRARAKRSSSSTSPRRTGRGGGAGSGERNSALEAFSRSKDQRQQILESLFALPEIIYAKIIMYL